MGEETIGTFEEVMEGVEEEVLDEDGNIIEDSEDEPEEEEEEEGESDEGEDDDSEDEDKEGESDEEADEEADGVQEGGEDEDEEGQTEEEKQVAARLAERHTVKIDGEEAEITTEEALKGYQTNQAAQKRFREAAEMREEAQSFFQAILKNPGDALTNFVARKSESGDRLSAREEVKRVFLEWLEPEIKESLIEDEKEREIHRLKRQLDDREKYSRESAQEAAEREEREQEQKFLMTLRSEIDRGLKGAELPMTDVLMTRVAHQLDASRRAGASQEEILRLVPSAVEAVAEERRSEAKALMKTLSPDELRQLAPEQAEAMTKAKVSRVKDARSKKKKGTGDVRKRKKRREPQFISTRDL